MAEEPQPANVTEGADPPDVLPANAEDRKAAKAMSSLEAKGDDEADSAKPKKEVDLKALSEAMKNLGGLGLGSDDKGGKGKEKVVKKDEPAKPLIKVDAADVTLLAEQLDISKVKATELLRAHEADAVKALTAWVTAEV